MVSHSWGHFWVACGSGNMLNATDTVISEKRIGLYLAIAIPGLVHMSTHWYASSSIVPQCPRHVHEQFAHSSRTVHEQCVVPKFGKFSNFCPDMSRSHDEFPNTLREFTSNLRLGTIEFVAMRNQKSCKCQPTFRLGVAVTHRRGPDPL